MNKGYQRLPNLTMNSPAGSTKLEVLSTITRWTYTWHCMKQDYLSTSCQYEFSKKKSHKIFFFPLFLINSNILHWLVHGNFPSAGPKLTHVAQAVYSRQTLHESTTLPFSNAEEREAIIACAHLDTLHNSYAVQSWNRVYSVSGTDIDETQT